MDSDDIEKKQSKSLFSWCLFSLEGFFFFLTQKANATVKWTSWPISEVSNCTWDESNTKEE